MLGTFKTVSETDRQVLVSTNREEEIKMEIYRGIFVSIPLNKLFIHIRESYMDGEKN